MTDLNKVLVYRMTHINNIPHIKKFGITHRLSNLSNSNYIPIGDNSLISNRNEFILKNGKKLGDYIPFYFGVRMPMLYVIQHGFNMVTPVAPENIIYIVSTVKKILSSNHDIIFTDGHAMDHFSSQYSTKNIHRIDEILDKEAIHAKYWKDEHDLDLKRRKEAEFLVLGDIPWSTILGFAVYNEYVKQKLISFGIEGSKIIVKPEYYF